MWLISLNCFEHMNGIPKQYGSQATEKSIKIAQSNNEKLPVEIVAK